MAGLRKSLFTSAFIFAALASAILVATPTAADRIDILTGFSFGGKLSGDGSVFSFIPSCGPDADCAFSPAILNLRTNRYASVDGRFDLSVVSEFSFDGSVVAGKHRNKPSIWTSDGMQILAEPRDPDHYENGVDATSADGLIVGGNLDDRPALWIKGDLQLLPEELRVRHGRISGISGDGELFVGHATSSTAGSRAFLSTLEATKTLGIPEGFLWSNATGISADGSTVIGFHHAVGTVDGARQVGFVWSEDSGMVELETMVPISATADGTVVVGDASPYPRTSRSAKIWDATNGVRDIHDVYAEEIKAVDPNLNMIQVTDISEDGRTIVGSGYSNFSAETAWILHIGDFEACDLNADGACDAVDIDGYHDYLGISDFYIRYNSAYDLNSDDRADVTDRNLLLDLMGVRPGDADLNGIVDMADFLAISAHFGEKGGWELGDFNGSGRIGFPDFLVLSRYFGSSVSQPAAVPEPSQATWLFFMAVAAWHAQRRRIE